MSFVRFPLSLVVVAVGVSLTPPLALAVAPVNINGVGMTGSARVGSVLGCSPGQWDNTGTPYTYSYKWNRDGSPIAGQTKSGYLVVAGDIGHPLSCTVTATNQAAEQTSVTTYQTSPQPAPPTVEITTYGRTVSGDAGSNAGVTAQVTLKRGGRVVNSTPVSPPTGVDGTWSATFPAVPARAPVVTSDQIVVHYAGSGAPSDFDNKAVSTNFPMPGWMSVPVVSSDGQKVTLSNSLARAKVTIQRAVGGTVSLELLPTFLTSAYWSQTMSAQVPGAAIVPGDRVDVTQYMDVDAPNGLVRLGAASPVGLPGQVGAPTCTADVSSGQVLCNPVADGLTYNLVRHRAGGPDVVRTASLEVGYPSYAYPTSDLASKAFSASATFADLKPDDAVDLTLAGPTPRVLTTLRVQAVHVDSVSNRTPFGAGTPNSTGTCAPDAWLTTSSEAACGADGTLPAGVQDYGYGYGIGSIDDFSGGQTRAATSEIYETVPFQGESVASSFTAYAVRGRQRLGFGGAVPVNYPVELKVFKSGTAVQVAGPVSVPPGSGTPISGLAPGEYDAYWVMTDPNGDHRTVITSFFVQAAGAGGPQGPPGPGGPAGPVGAQGASAKAAGVPKIKCTVVRARSKPIRVTCRVAKAGAARAVVATMTRGGRTVAVGGAVVRKQRAVVRLVLRRSARSGRYVVSVTLAGRTAAQVGRRVVVQLGV